MGIKRLVALVALSVTGLAAPAAAVTPTAKPNANPNGPPAITARSAELVSLGPSDNGGRILFARGVHAVRPPASLTKMLAALVVRDRYRLDEIVSVSSLVNTVSGSKLSLEPGMHIPVRDLLYALLLKSANDAAVALAAHDPYGYEHFIQLMNEKARSIGAYDSQFRNPHGLDMTGHFSSASDMAVIARQVLADPVLARIVATRRYSMAWRRGTRRVFVNHNKLIGRYPDTVGVKTGFTVQAGHCLVTATRTPDGILLVVVMGSQDHYRDTKALLDYGKRLEARAAAGGGGVDSGPRLAQIPAPVPDGLRFSASAPLGADPRDDLRWVVVMGVLALLTAATLALRRRPEAEVSDVQAWLASLTRRD